MIKKKKFMGVQQVLLHPNLEDEAILRYLCEQSGAVYNSGMYFARQTYFKTKKILTGKFDLIYEPSISKSLTAQSMPSSPLQQTLISVVEAWKSYKALKSLHFKGQLHFRPKPPKYLEGSKLFKVAYTNGKKQGASVSDGVLRLSLGLTVKRWFGVSELLLPMPTNLDVSKVKEFTILPSNGSFYLECSYEVPKEIHDLDPALALGIDLGTSANIAACVDTLGNSFLIDAFQMKSMNQWWNKQVATTKEGKDGDYWSPNLDRLTQKRNHQMRDGVNKAAKLIVDHAIKHCISNIVCGWVKASKSIQTWGI